MQHCPRKPSVLFVKTTQSSTPRAHSPWSIPCFNALGQFFEDVSECTARVFPPFTSCRCPFVCVGFQPKSISVAMTLVMRPLTRLQRPLKIRFRFVFIVFRDEGVVPPRLSSSCTQRRITNAETSVWVPHLPRRRPGRRPLHLAKNTLN